MPAPTEVESNAPNGAKPWLNRNEAVEYLQSLGFAAVTLDTIKYHSCSTGKLPRPKKIAGNSYWHRSDLDKLVEAL